MVRLVRSVSRGFMVVRQRLRGFGHIVMESFARLF